MPRELPSTASLRSFVHAARTLSFKRAAAELHVSPSALSRQIQALEDLLGVRLFQRLNPGIALTDEGRRYLEAAEAALTRLEAAQEQLAPRPRPLRISALESFSESWLIPHLPDFERVHPEIEIELEATLRYADFTRDVVDVAIRFGVGPWPGLHGEPILELEYFPVCSPRLAKEAGLRRPGDLASQTLIHVAQTPQAWSAWLRAAGVAELTPRRSVTYDHVSLALAAAEEGQGIALAPPILCAQRLRSKRLCRPFRESLRSDATYHFVCRPEALADPRIAALREWLLTELAKPGARRASAGAN